MTQAPNNDHTWNIAHLQNHLRDAADLLVDSVVKSQLTTQEMILARQLFLEVANSELTGSMNRTVDRILKQEFGMGDEEVTQFRAETLAEVEKNRPTKNWLSGIVNS